MKTITTILLGFVLLISTSFAPLPVPTSVQLGEEITIGTTATEYVIDVTHVQLSSPTQTFYIVCTTGNSGTIQFSVGAAPIAAAKGNAADARVIMQGVRNGYKNIWADGSGAGQKFTIF